MWVKLMSTIDKTWVVHNAPWLKVHDDHHEDPFMLLLGPLFMDVVGRASSLA